MNRLHHALQIAALSLLASALGACAGPTTPLGAVKVLWPSGGKAALFMQRAFASEGPRPVLHYYPSRQVLHGAHPLTIVIEDPSGLSHSERDFQVSYNGFDVTASLLEQASVKRTGNGRNLAIHLTSVKLLGSLDHTIEVSYKSSGGAVAIEKYPAPTCDTFEKKRIATLDRYRPPRKLVALIERLSGEMGFNPAFIAGLVAKESGFDPNAISASHAIGLTQVTGIGESLIEQTIASWPRYPGIGDISVPMLKDMVREGEINAKNEWRLNPELSIRGGLAFIATLHKQWSSAENQARISTVATMTGESANDLRTKLVLASYNFGYTRVLGAFKRSPVSWQKDPELIGVQGYLNPIVSSCNHFAQPEERETFEALSPENSEDAEEARASTTTDDTYIAKEGGLHENQT